MPLPWKSRQTRRYGWQPDLPDHRDLACRAARGAACRPQPARVDLRAGSIALPPCADQGELGSCVAHGCGFAWHFALLKQLCPAPLPARLFIYYFARALAGMEREDAGAQIRDGCKALNKFGCCDEALWPYNVAAFASRPSTEALEAAEKHQALQYFRLPQSPERLRACLVDGYPVVFGFTLYDAFESLAVAASGRLELPRAGERALGGHCVALVGYDNVARRFIARNSWGEKWGMNGYFSIPYEYALNPGLARDFWTIRVVEM